MRGINPPALFELRAPGSPSRSSERRLAECRGLAPLARGHALVSTEARFACPVDIPKWSAWQDSHLQPFRLERNASAFGYTRWCPRPDSHRHFARSKCAVSALDYVGATNADLTCACLARLPFCTLHSPLCTRRWCRVREFHPQPLRSERSASGSWANAAKWHSRQDSHLQPGGSKPPALIV